MATTFETYYGMLSSEDYVSTAHPRYTWRPETWDQSLLLMDPNGSASISAMMSLGSKVKATSPRFHWGEQSMPDDYGTISQVWHDSNMASAGDAYSPVSASMTSAAGGGRASSGETLYFQMAAAQASKFVVGQTVMTRDNSNTINQVRGLVTAVTINGASSYITVVLLEGDDNSGTFTLCADAADGLSIYGNVNAEGAEPPNPVAYMHQDKENCTQIFRDSMKNSRTARLTKLRTPQQVRKARRELNMMHHARMEKTLLHGLYNPDYTIGSEPARLTGGLDNYITSNVYTFSGTWSSGGKTFLDTAFAAMAAKKPQGMSSNRRLAVCGQSAYVAITSLVYGQSMVQWQLTEASSIFGFNIKTWRHPLLDVDFIVHPLLTYDTSYTKSIYMILPQLLEVHDVTPTTYRRKVGTNGMDGDMSELLTERGFAVKGEEMMCIMHNVGG